ncbi:Sodium/hydrogen exchanger family-domain-containing protein [Xylaria sp. FL0933]|nr:Sodium/hydrogen exchanger family-domain-containing protein [Xylaria sp. FL0933]
MMATQGYLPYYEPSLVELLISTTFLLALNIINSVLDRTLACGLVGQVLIGTAWGQPGARWLSLDFQRAVSSLGYLGLILIVYAGGVETDVVALRKNLLLSVAVAATGVVVPIGLSFALLAPAGSFLETTSAALLPAFAAGAALCSTSLGTTFSVLQASGLSRTRLGAVLASAALIDDVAGLVMVRIISSLGQTKNGSIEPATILRPLLVSIGFAVAVPLVCRYALKPAQGIRDRIISGGNEKEKEKEDESAGKGVRVRVRSWICSQEAAFIFQTALLILLIVAADYAGTSVLLAAYLAGVVVRWWDGQWDDTRGRSQALCVESDSREIPISTERQSQAQPLHGQRASNAGSSSETPKQEIIAVRHTGLEVFNTYYAQMVSRVLKPFFFASIGFSIPISQLFVGKIVWRGISYSILMVIGKLVCGLWLVRFPISRRGRRQSLSPPITSKLEQMLSRIRSWSLSPVRRSTAAHGIQPSENPSMQTAPIEPSHSHGPGSNHSAPPPSLNHEVATPPKPLSLYPAAVIGCAMVVRGEIGFLISSLAESQGVFRHADEDPSGASELFLIVTWAIFLCTILGPLCAGLLVRHIKRLEKATESSRGGASSVLAAWVVGSIR